MRLIYLQGTIVIGAIITLVFLIWLIREKNRGGVWEDYSFAKKVIIVLTIIAIAVLFVAPISGWGLNKICYNNEPTEYRVVQNYNVIKNSVLLADVIILVSTVYQIKGKKESEFKVHLFISAFCSIACAIALICWAETITNYYDTNIEITVVTEPGMVTLVDDVVYVNYDNIIIAKDYGDDGREIEWIPYYYNWKDDIEFSKVPASRTKFVVDDRKQLVGTSEVSVYYKENKDTGKKKICGSEEYKSYIFYIPEDMMPGSVSK